MNTSPFPPKWSTYFQAVKASRTVLMLVSMIAGLILLLVLTDTLGTYDGIIAGVVGGALVTIFGQRVLIGLEVEGDNLQLTFLRVSLILRLKTKIQTYPLAQVHKIEYLEESKSKPSQIHLILKQVKVVSHEYTVQSHEYWREQIAEVHLQAGRWGDS